MSKMVLEIPAELREALRVPPEEQLARLRRELAVRLYQKGLLSFAKLELLPRRFPDGILYMEALRAVGEVGS